MLPKPKTKRHVYLDHAATTYMDKRVLEAMRSFFIKNYGNPSSIYTLGRQASQYLNQARKKIANLINTRPLQIVFTAGGTESDNMAIYGVAYEHQNQGRHIVSIAIEHHAVLNPLQDLAKQGWEITYVKIDKYGRVDPKDVAKAIRPDTVLVSIMYANNEIGAIEPIAQIGREILKYRKQHSSVYPFFHTDACQAAGYLDMDVEKLHVDLMTVNGSKIYGPKGAGFLYIRQGIKIKPLILGGSQERKLRAGTENVPAIMGLARAFELAQAGRIKNSAKIAKLRDYLWQKIRTQIKGIKLNGPDLGADRLPNNLNVSFNDVEGEAMLLYLDEYGIMCSTGSACNSDSLDPSHVLTAIGLPYELAHGSLRFSLGAVNTKADIDYTMKYLPLIINQLREISPTNLEKKQHAKYKK
ncbi:MAG: cysteine desulfurase NifS [Candidatus Magasanikbacteria bacterium CG10_big_fil_rev_8_21_14_0_10_40_10]|uniref:Cysteine desulfurase NifS n=1 Tax=Candidatus Magasanikbacteria bacterium CG10_big_fil_rev_8_21_14_0_10_40_10 TaxID=1974648 RepID=A0A2M6W4W8_9BACT|nr:MAG: cysteine desulfurase NifS [Candidatus Magasanikbacteria bacterium CG10_big_fil_rev_8_21_14_0_10_40_10]